MTTYVECPVCFGEGGWDERDCNALLKEHLPDHVLAEVPNIDVDWMECPECEGTCRVTERRAKDIHAMAVAAVDQIRARFEEEELRARCP